MKCPFSKPSCNSAIDASYRSGNVTACERTPVLEPKADVKRLEGRQLLSRADHAANTRSPNDSLRMTAHCHKLRCAPDCPCFTAGFIDSRALLSSVVVSGIMGRTASSGVTMSRSTSQRKPSMKFLPKSGLLIRTKRDRGGSYRDRAYETKRTGVFTTDNVGCWKDTGLVVNVGVAGTRQSISG